jgi:D-beta-D-heptose 7-phosphate kinase/D-beta-D-heptose 1-phosphate adenosyltransferase
MKTIFVNGTFDILHPGHVQLLNYARSLGDSLLVAIDGDQRVRELKGSGRPINSEDDRKLMLESLRSVDSVWIFNSDQELEDICRLYNPVMVKGSDYKDKHIIGQQYCKEIVFYDRIEPYSTTQAIQGISSR